MDYKLHLVCGCMMCAFLDMVNMLGKSQYSQTNNDFFPLGEVSWAKLDAMLAFAGSSHQGTFILSNNKYLLSVYAPFLLRICSDLDMTLLKVEYFRWEKEKKGAGGE